MRKIQLFGLAVLALSVSLSSASAFDFVGVVNAPVEGAAHFVYDPATGASSFASPGDPLTSMQVVSSVADLFIPGNATWTPEPPFEQNNGTKQFVFRLGAGREWTEFPLGNVLAPGLSADYLMSTLTTDGARAAGGKINTSPGGGPLLLYVPEPSSIALVCCGLLGLLSLRRK